MGSGGSPVGRRRRVRSAFLSRAEPPSAQRGKPSRAMAGVDKKKMNFGGNDAAIQRNRHALRGL